MTEEVPIEFTVSKESAEAAMRRDEIEADELFEYLDQFAETYHFIQDVDYSPTGDEIQKVLRIQDIERPLQTSIVLDKMEAWGLIEVDGKGWTTS